MKKKIIKIKEMLWEKKYFVLGLLVIFIILDLVMGFAAAISVALLIVFLVFRWSSTYILFPALVSLLVCPFLEIVKADSLAEQMALHAYFFLIVALVVRFVEFVRDKEENTAENPVFEKAEATPQKQPGKPVSAKPRLTSQQALYRIIAFPVVIVLVSISLFFIISPGVQPFFESLKKPGEGSGEKFNVSNERSENTAQKPESQSVQMVPSNKKTAYKIKIQNGSGVDGMAAEAAEILKKKGYDLETADLGNADNYNYKATEIYFKKGRESEAKALAGDLGRKSFTISPEMKPDSKYDFLIILGVND